MTVVEYDPTDSFDVTCKWFSYGKLEEKSFHQDLLKKCRPGVIPVKES